MKILDGTLASRASWWSARRGTGLMVALVLLSAPFVRAAPETPAAGAVSVGVFHVLALRSDGTVWAWGSNATGALGDGTTNSRTFPVPVSDLSHVAAIAAGRTHSLALKTDGTVWAWGSNGGGELGDGTTAPRLKPVPVAGLQDVVAIAAGGLHFSLALKRDGTVWAWGDNYFGQLGDSTRTPRLRAVAVRGLAPASAIAAGNGHAVALLNDGTVAAWGANALGQLGDGSQADRATPVIVPGVSDIVAVTAGSLSHTLALRRDGTLLAWGNNYSGQLGDDTAVCRSSPGVVPGLPSIVEMAAGSSHNVALAADGTVWTWGSNLSGQLNSDTPAERMKPTRTETFPGNVATVAAAGNQTAVLTTAGRVLVVGTNDWGQWGDGSVANAAPPPVPSDENVTGQIEPTTPWVSANRVWHEARDFSTKPAPREG